MTATTSPTGHELLPHTADAILHAWGPTRAACLGEAAVGLIGSVPAGSPPTGADVEISLEESDDTELLVRLLEEVLFLVDSGGVVPVGANLHDNGDAVTGTLRVVPVDAHTDVTIVAKGVSRAGLRCSQTDGRWECWAIIDV